MRFRQSNVYKTLGKVLETHYVFNIFAIVITYLQGHIVGYRQAIFLPHA